MARKAPDPSDPGDQIEVSITAEAKNKRGLSLWIKAGLSSTQRPDESTDEAFGRVAQFVIDRVDDLTQEFLS